MLTCLDAALRASKPLAVEEFRPCALEGGTRSLLMQRERGAEVLVQVLVWPEQAVQAGDGGERPASIEGAGELSELGQFARRGFLLPRARRGARPGPRPDGASRSQPTGARDPARVDPASLEAVLAAGSFRARAEPA